MGVHSSDYRVFVSPTGSVKKEGGRLDLAKDQVGLFAIDNQHLTKKGAKAVSNLKGFNTKTSLFEFSQGIDRQKMFNSRTRQSDNKKSVPFKLEQVRKVGAYVPTNDALKVDEYIVGYDGFNSKSLEFNAGDAWQLQVNMFGKVPAWFNDGSTEYSINKGVVVPTGNFMDPCVDGDICASVDCKEGTLELVKSFNDHTMPDGTPFTNYVEVSPILECSGTTEEETYTKVLWQLEYCGFGNDKELSKVQAQYPDYEIKRDTVSNKFVVMLDEGVTPEAFEVRFDSFGVFGCDTCPEGFTAEGGGYVYAVNVEDDGEDVSGDIENLTPTATATKTGQKHGVGYYIVNSETKVTDAQMEAFINGVEEVTDEEGNVTTEAQAAQPTAQVVFVGKAQEVCTNDAIEEKAWEEVDSCTYVRREYVITLPDSCEESRLDELQEAYPDLEIAEVEDPAPSNCLRQYTTTVESAIKCEEGCSDIVKRVYETEAPEPFGVNQYWVPAITAENSEDCKCGIRFRGKPAILAADGCLTDEVPFVYTSAQFKVAYAPSDIYLNSPITEKSIPIRQISRAKDVSNLGGNLRSFEKESNAYFLGEKHYDSYLSRGLLGLNERLENFTLYATYFVEVDRTYKAQSLGQYAMDSISYHFFVPVGQDKEIKDLVNMVAAGAGVPGV